jgi:hypothetical protein
MEDWVAISISQPNPVPMVNVNMRKTIEKIFVRLKVAELEEAMQEYRTGKFGALS